MANSNIKEVMLVKPKSVGGNFEYAAIPVQGLLFLSGALKQHAERSGNPLYDTQIWFEDRYNLRKIDPVKDLEGIDLLVMTALISEYPRASEIIRQAKAAHPNIKIIGGGPQMGALPKDALEDGVDVVVQKEGEMIIGPLADILLSEASDITQRLYQLDGITFMDNGSLAITPISNERLNTPPDFVQLPDFDAMRGVDKQNPMLAGVLETRRGCIEHCDYCQVIQQFKGYRAISRTSELARIAQLQKLAADGKIYTNARGAFSVFITDDLHIPPSRAEKFRQERYQRTLQWKDRTEGMHFTAQIRAEAGQDPRMLDAFREVGGDMVYVGVESLVQENLIAVKKRQEVEQIKIDLLELKKRFRVVAMLIAGLPGDTEQSLMEMAEEIKDYSNYQTDNMITPLPATHYWTTFKPLDADGSLLPQEKRRPYHLYTGRQFVHQDTVRGREWTMQESARIEQEFRSRLRHIDPLYETMFRHMRKQLQQRHETSPAQIIS